jgi:RNA polymerase sigma factor (sigma-70 family)
MKVEADFVGTLEAARAGSEGAWLTLYRQFAPSVRGYFRSRGAAEPDDLTGEVFLQLVRDLRTFRGDERAFRAWLFTIAHHRFVDERRRRSRRRDELTLDGVLDSGAPTGDAESDAFEKLATDHLRTLIGSLTSNQQDVLLLRIFGDLTVDEVGRAMGKRSGAVKALQRRALASLRKKLRHRP